MPDNFKNIHIGRLIYQRMQECEVSVERASRFLKVQEEEMENISSRKSADSAQLLAWSKLLEYDFFRIYSQHLILYAPQDVNKAKREKKKKETTLPRIYTHEVILFLVELVQNSKRTTLDIQKEYNIPSTTILRWVGWINTGSKDNSENRNRGK